VTQGPHTEQPAPSSPVVSDAELPAIWPTLRRGVEAFDKASMVVIMAAMAAMTIMVSLQVVWRYLLNSSIDSADEVSRLFFVWVIFLAIPHGIKYAVHVGIDLLIMNLSARHKEWLFRGVSLCSAVLMAGIFWAAWVATLDKWPELMPTLPITAGIYYVAVLICAAHSFVHLVLHAWLGSRIWEGRLS
jgi:TRAP-type C4-dicarboxylate transport system permease small subunit